MIRSFIVFFVGAITSIAIYAGLQYGGHWFVYTLFTLSANALLFNGFRKNALFFDTFIGVFLWLGFWLKFSYRIAFSSATFQTPTGAFNGSPQAFDHALLISSCGLVALIVASLVRARFFSYPDRPPPCGQLGLFALYRSYRFLFLASFIAVVVLVAVTNIWLEIYQRGMVARTVLPIGGNGIYKWLLQFGLASVSALIIRFEIELNRNLTFMAIFPALLESFLSNVSLLSRGMVLNASALGFGGLRMMGAMKRHVNPLWFSFAVISFIVLFVLSVFWVNYLRADSVAPVDPAPAALNFEDRRWQEEERWKQVKQWHEEQARRKINTVGLMTAPLFLDRWVGIEGVMAVSSSDILGWRLWWDAWQERYDNSRPSLYDAAFFIDSPYADPKIDSSKYHFISMPGLIAFLYYPGSALFLFIAMLVFALAAASAEIVIYRLCGGNLILCSLFAQVIAFRYASFGYVPAQSYLLFGTLALNCLLLFAADKFLVGRMSPSLQATG